MASFTEIDQDTSNITIDPSGDLTIKIIECDYRVPKVNGERPILKIAFMKVHREILRKNSSVLEISLNPDGPWEESTKDIVELKDLTVASAELWFRLFHDTLTKEMYKIPVKEIWHSFEVSRKYFLKIEMLNSWFARWWILQNKEELEVDDLRELLYPCHEFNNAEAFAYVTKRLVYEGVGHITEINPTHHLHLHLRQHVIQQLNAAKGSLRAKLHRGIFEFIKKFLNSNCTCKEKALFQYCKGLDRTGVWPLEEHGGHKSLQTLLCRLGEFRYDAPEDGCNQCRSNLGIDVVQTTEMVKMNFQGLCLDCMDISNPNTRDDDYWRHDREREWDIGCRICHKQPTWYFSFMGRKAEMDAHKEWQKERQRRWT